MRRVGTQTGLTLIEAIIYIALFALIVSTAIATAYNLIGSTEELDEITMTEVEAHFILHSIGHELNEAERVVWITPSELDVVDREGATTTFMYVDASSSIAVSRDGGIVTPLHSEILTVDNLSFTVSGVDLQRVDVNLTINDTVFNDVSYYVY